MKAVDMALRLEGIAHRVDAAGVEPWSLMVDGRRVTVQCSSADDVDAVMGLLDDAPAPHPSAPTLYSRWATFDEVLSVQVYGPARAGACRSCGHVCDHTREARIAAESAEVEASLARTDAFARANPGSGVTS